MIDNFDRHLPAGMRITAISLRRVCSSLLVAIVMGFLICNQTVSAQEALPVSISVFEDQQRSVSSEEILSSPDSFAFNATEGQHNFGLSRSNFWFRVDIPPAEEDQQQMLEISYALLDEVDIYTYTDKRWQHLALGDMRPLSNREIIHQYFLKSVQARAGELQQIFLRVRSDGPVIVPIKVWEMGVYHQYDHNRTLLEGLYFGVLLALILFNLFVYLSIRSRSYLYYVGYLSFITLFLLSLKGLVVTYILPDSPLLNSRLTFVSLYLALMVAFTFTASINNTYRISPGLVRLFKLMSMLILVFLVAGLFLGVGFLTMVTPYLTVVSIALYIHAIIRGIRAAYKPSYYVGFAFLMLLPGVILYILRMTGLLDTGSWPQVILQTGIALEALLLSLVLSYRIRYTQERLEQVQQFARDERRSFSRKLIEIRDSELQQLAMELHDGLGQNLLAIKSKLSRILRPDIKETEKHTAARDGQQIAQSTIDDIRRISHQLHPHILDRLGLKEAIIQVANDTCEAPEVEVSCEIEDIKLAKNSPLALHLYRIIQEAVKNCAVHADAAAVVIVLHYSDQMLHLRVEDFPAQARANWLESLDYSQSFGLSNIQQRVELLKGKTLFSHNDSSGFRIEITVPFSAQ